MKLRGKGFSFFLLGLLSWQNVSLELERVRPPHELLPEKEASVRKAAELRGRVLMAPRGVLGQA